MSSSDHPEGSDGTVKATPLLFTPLANTTTFPVVAPVGTVTEILVAVQLPTVAVVPLNFTVPAPWGEPKLVPVKVTAAPTAPVVTDKLVMLGAETTVKLFVLLFTPLANTTTFPVVAPVGTVTEILVAVQLPTVAVVPLNFTVPVPWGEPKLVPVKVTAAPTAPVATDKLVILGAETTVNAEPLLFTPPTFTTTLPEVAPVGTSAVILVRVQFVTDALVPLNLIVLVPCGLPKFAPEITTDAPTAPAVGERLVILGEVAKA
jgi:hypothetical protein